MKVCRHMLTLLDVKARRILGIFDKNTPELQMKKLEIKESFTERKKKKEKRNKEERQRASCVRQRERAGEF